MAKYFDRIDAMYGLGHDGSPAGDGMFWNDMALDSLDQGDFEMAFRRATQGQNDFYGQLSEDDAYYKPNDPAYQRTPKPPLPAVQRGPHPMPSQSRSSTNLNQARSDAYGPGEWEQARRNAYAQGIGEDFDRTHPSTMPGNPYGDEGDRLSALIASGDSSLTPNFPLDRAGALQLKAAQEAQRAFMAQQGIQGKQDAAAMKATQQLLANPGMQFGKGGGDWASAWSKAMQPNRGIFESLVGNQLGSFLDYGKGLNQTFNSATGPYGQMQAAAVATAPSRAQRVISKDKLGMLSGLFDQMSANKTPSVSSVETDYGAYAKMLPSLMKKYLPGG